MALRLYQARVFKHLGAATSRPRLFHSKPGSKVVSSYAVVTTGDVGNLEALTAFVASRPNNQLKISPIYHSACKPVSSEGVPRYKVVVDMSGNKVKAENLQLSLFNIAEDSCDEREGGVWEIEGGIGVAAHYALYIQVMKTVENHAASFNITLPLKNDAALEEVKRVPGVVNIVPLSAKGKTA